MAASSSVVIKVKHGDSLRRFEAQISGNDELNLTMDGLRNKIISLFSFDPDTDLMLTYIDEDDDVVTLADDDDLRDVVKQGLKPLRITVKVDAEKNGHGVPEILKLLVPLYDTLLKLSADLTSKASSSELVQQSLQNLNTGVCDVAAKARVSIDEVTKKSSLVPATVELAVDRSAKTKLDVENNEVKIQSVSGLAMEDSSENSDRVYSHSDFISSGLDKKQILLKNLVNKVNGKAYLASQTAPVENNIGKDAGLSIPFSGLGAKTGSSSFPLPASEGDFVRRIINHNDYSGNIFHRGIICDGCGVLPITGPRFKSKVKDDYDLCSICFEDMGNDTDYIRMDRSISHKDYSGNIFHYEISCDDCDVLPITGPRFKSKVKADYDLCSICFKDMGNDTDYIRMDRSISHNDYSGNIFHCGVGCDGCGVLPITGPRFKSKVKVDYDLCIICFKDMGNYTDYIRMDRPAVYRHLSLKGLQEARARGPTFQQVHKDVNIFKVKPVAAKLDSCFIKDVNIFDGTVMAPLTPFTKIWRMKNNGTVAWPEKTKLVWIGGDKLSNGLAVEIPIAGLMIGEEFEVEVDFISPELPGRYDSYWRIALPSGERFGHRVWVLIQVDSSLAEAPQLENVRNLNLNLPPMNTTVPEIINVHPQPMVEDVSFGPAIPIKREDPVQQLNTEQELQFPINDSLLVGDGGSSSLVVSYPIDLADVVPAVPSMGPTGFYPVQGQTPYASAPPVDGARKIEDELPVKMVVEEQLLKELEEMGLKEADLNKQTLRMNGYDLVQAVDDLCGVAEWDPILEELQEMGFHDMTTNKMLLKKNNGSIKRVVMDLIAVEKIE